MKSIAVGVGDNKEVLKAVNAFRKEKDINIKLIYSDEELVKSIKDKEVDAVIRGSLPASGVIKELKKTYPHISRATYVNGENEFLLAPVGIDEGNSLDEKFKIAKNCGEFLEKLEKTPKIAVLAKGRKGDYKRSEIISKSIDESEKLTEMIKTKTNFKVKNYYILIEQAINDKCNILIAPNGVIGNIIFRTLILVNKWPSNGAITFGVKSIYIDTSRDQNCETYLRSLKLACNLANI